MKLLTITLPSGAVVGVPVDVIARNRAAAYASEFDGDIERSLKEDTEPLFESDSYAIKDWAANNMNWSDVEQFAVRVEPAPAPDMQEAWMNGPKDVRDIEALVADHDRDFIGLSLIVAIDLLGGNIALTEQDFEAAMKQGLMSEQQGETVLLKTAPRADVETLLAGLTNA